MSAERLEAMQTARSADSHGSAGHPPRCRRAGGSISSQTAGPVATATLEEFSRHIRHCDPAVLRYHLSRGDFPRWITDAQPAG